LQGLRASVGFEAGIGWWVVNVSLNKSQSSAFNRMAARDYHKVVASLVEGVALMEARVQVTDFQGSFAIASPYMTKKSAERIARQLDPA
jgi:preprotein translocase subunit SecD